MKRDKYSLIVDCGSTNLKVGLFCGLDLLDSRESRIRIKRQHGEVEFDLKWVGDQALKWLHVLLKNNADRVPNIVGIGITGQRSSVGFWTNDQVLGPALSWEDVRTQKDMALFQKYETEIESRTGLRLSPHYAAPKIRWALKTQSKIKKAHQSQKLKLGSVSCYLNYLFTQGRTYAIDHTHAQRMLLMNINTLKWDSKLCEWFGIGKESLPKLQAVEADYGFFKWDAHRIPITHCMGDAQAALWAQGFGAKRPVAIQYGSGAFVGIHSGKKRQWAPRLLQSILYTKRNEIQFFVEGTVNAAGRLIDRTQKKRAIPHRHFAIKSSAFVPTLKGLGAPFWDASAELASFGSKPKTQTEVYRSVAYACRHILSWAKHFMNFRAPSISVGGGLCHNARFVSTQSEVLDARLEVASASTSSMLGLAMLVCKRKGIEHRHVRSAGQKKILSSQDWAKGIRQCQLTKSPAWQKSAWLARLSENQPLVFGHRGSPKKAPENTMESIEAAFEDGADGVEFDVQLSRDGVPMLFHDADLYRMSGQKEAFTKYSYAELKKLNLGSKKKLVRIPSLQEVLREFTSKLLYIEVKDTQSDSKLWKEIFKTIKKANAQKRACLASFNTEMALKFKKEHPDTLVGAIMGRRHPAFDFKRGIYPELDVLSFRHTRVDAKTIELAWLQSQMTCAWTVNRRSTADRMFNVGVDLVVSDVPEKIVQKK